MCQRSRPFTLANNRGSAVSSDFRNTMVYYDSRLKRLLVVKVLVISPRPVTMPMYYQSDMIIACFLQQMWYKRCLVRMVGENRIDVCFLSSRYSQLRWMVCIDNPTDKTGLQIKWQLVAVFEV